MTKKCCVPGCKTNYESFKGERISVFLFPVDPDRRQLWINKIPRENFIPGKFAVVCAKHFSEEFIVRIDTVTKPDGSILSVERTTPKLTKDAYPSLFPNCPSPSDLSAEPPLKRKKHNEAEKLDKKAIAEWMEKDKINSYEHFIVTYSDHTDQLWLSKTRNDFISFYLITDELTHVPKLQMTIRIYRNLHVDVYKENNVKISDSSMEWIFGISKTPSTLSRWSQFKCLLELGRAKSRRTSNSTL